MAYIVYIFRVRNHWNVETWNQLKRSDFQAIFQITLFYLELFHDKAMQTAKEGFKK